VASTISKTTAAAFIAQKWTNEALVALSNETVLPKIVNRGWDPIPRNQGDTINILNALAINANAKAVQTEVTLQTPTFATTALVVDKHYESTIAVEDVAKTLMNDAKMKAFTDGAVKAIANQIDSDLIAATSNFTGTVEGVQGLAVAPSNLRAADKKLSDAKAPALNRVLVVGTQTKSDLLGQALFVQASSNANSTAIETARLTNLFGMTVYMDQNVSRSGGGDKNIAFAGDALALGMAAMYSPGDEFSGIISAVAGDEKTGLGIRFTSSWSHKDMATLMSYDALYGVKVVRVTLGLYVYGA